MHLWHERVCPDVAYSISILKFQGLVLRQFYFL